MARNGFLAEDGIVLVTVEDNDQLIATAAASFSAMKAAAARDRVALSIVEPAGAYRRAWVQNDMVDHPERYNLNPKSVIGFSRYGQSHGWGNRIDVNSAALPWMLRNAARFGWTREYGSRDPNHFKHDGATATGGGLAGGVETSTPVPIRKEEPVAFRIINALREGVGRHYVFVSDTRTTISTELSSLSGSALEYEVASMRTQARLAGLGDNFTPPECVETNPAENWNVRDEFCWRANGMPIGFPLSPANPFDRESLSSGGATATIDYDVLAQKTAALIDFPTTLTIDPPEVTGTLS